MASDTQHVTPPVKPIQSSERSWPAVLTSKNLSIVITGAVLIVAILKAERKDVPEIIRILLESQVWATTGWVIAVVILLSSIVMIKLLVRFYDQELKRVAKERDELQSILIGRSRG